MNVPSENLPAEVNICGSKSGRNYDKSTLFDTFFGKRKTAPMIRECPINMERAVSEILDYDRNEGIIGMVIQSYVEPECSGDGKLDMRKVRPIVWATGGDFNYYRLGERISQEAEDTDQG